MKNTLGIITGITLITLLALNLYPNQSSQAPQNQPEIAASILATSQNTQEAVKAQTAAWYRYFDLQEIPQTTDNPSTLQIKARSEQNQKGFVVFSLVNFTAKVQEFKTQDGSLIMIQEALNPEGEWAPIEYWDYDWGLGSDFSKLELKPNHSVLIAAPRFKGDFNTKLRLKLKVDDSEKILYSEAFSGKVNIGQFDTPTPAKKTISYLK